MGSFGFWHIMLLVGLVAILVPIVGVIRPSIFARRDSKPIKRIYFALAAIVIFFALRGIDSTLGSKEVYSGTSSEIPVTTTSPAATTPVATAPTQEDGITKYCSVIASHAGGSYQIENECRKEEIEARSKLLKLKLPARVESYCTKVSNAIGGSYQIKLTCAEEELTARAQQG